MSWSCRLLMCLCQTNVHGIVHISAVSSVSAPRPVLHSIVQSASFTFSIGQQAILVGARVQNSNRPSWARSTAEIRRGLRGPLLVVSLSTGTRTVCVSHWPPDPSTRTNLARHVTFCRALAMTLPFQHHHVPCCMRSERNRSACPRAPSQRGPCPYIGCYVLFACV